MPTLRRHTNDHPSLSLEYLITSQGPQQLQACGFDIPPDKDPGAVGLCIASDSG